MSEVTKSERKESNPAQSTSERPSSDIIFYADADASPLIDEGIYRVAYYSHNKGNFFGPKLFMWFKVIEPGKYFGFKVYRAYNFYKPLKRSSDLFKDLAKLHGGHVTRRTPLPLALFKDKVLCARVRTVIADRKQRVLSNESRYSVIDEIIGVDQ